VATAETIEAQFNPEKFLFGIGVNYEEQDVPGAGYKPLQYKNTDNPQMTIELFYRVVTEEEQLIRDDAERFLLSLCYPRRGAGTIPQHPPPRMLIVWPSYVRLNVVVRRLDIQAIRFNRLGAPIEEKFSLTVDEIRDGQIFSEDVRSQGLRRASSLAVGGNSGGGSSLLRSWPEGS